MNAFLISLCIGSVIGIIVFCICSVIVLKINEQSKNQYLKKNKLTILEEKAEMDEVIQFWEQLGKNK